MNRFRLLLLILCLLPVLAQAKSTSILVDTTWLAKQLGQKEIAIIDMSDSMQYSRFHIPGARHLPYNAINQFTRQRVSLSIGSQNIARLMGQLGVTADMHIVIYDDVGGLNASRLFWELERLGHQKLSLLDGGLVKWILEGHRVVAKHAQYPKTVYRPRQMDTDSQLAKLDEVTRAEESKALLIDVRSQEEYQGHPRQKNSGHIQGARWWQWEDNVDFDNAFRIKPDKLLNKAATAIGLLDKNQPAIVYCRSGHRAAHTYFVLRKLGYQKVKLYDGSMAEYTQRHPGTIKRGDRP